MKSKSAVGNSISPVSNQYWLLNRVIGVNPFLLRFAVWPQIYKAKEMDYTLDNRVLQKVYEERDLGVIIYVDMKASFQCVKASDAISTE